MKPVQVSVHVPFSRDDVYDFLAVSANHEPFNRHMLSDWSFEGPPSGVGSITHATATLGGRRDPVDIEVIEDVPGECIVERNVGAAGKRIATGTYTLTANATSTIITFEYAWQSAPLAERMSGAIVRKIMRGALETSMRSLADELNATLARQVDSPSS